MHFSNSIEVKRSVHQAFGRDKDFFKLFLVFSIHCLLSMILKSYESPIPSSMPRRLNHDKGCWEREGTATLGRAVVASEV